MKRIKLIVVALLILFCLTACAEVVKTEKERVNAEIVSVYYFPCWLQPLKTGDTIMFITHPASYEVKLRYKDTETVIDDYDLYKECKDKVGDELECVLITKHYSDGTTQKQIVER